MRAYILAGMAASILIMQTGIANAAGDAEKGKAQFNICKICHSLDAGKNMVGPSLHGVFGRKSGTAPGFNYSDAMKAKAVVWDDDTIGQYVADPKGYIPNNKMAFAGIKKQEDRDNLIAYLKEATK
ncbi:MAG TPA: cytochrome c family protein [Candidatus Cybelea sp.]|nr:cytochrome c family protein [Candidatus Cybelea sp.]